jgi:hypothetical protein
MQPIYYNGRMYLVFHARSHPYTYVYMWPDMSNAGRLIPFSYRRPEAGR